MTQDPVLAALARLEERIGPAAAVRALTRIGRALGRAIDRFCDSMDSIGPQPDWRIKRHEDGLYYVEWDHIDQGWTYFEPGYQSAMDAAAAGRTKFGRRGA